MLVDEYQDTNRLQSDFVDAIGGGHHQIMAVGDDAQSIYSWRGAKVEHILSFPERHPGTKLVRLETNYRSIPQILDLANHSISHNPKQFPKNLKAVREAGVKPAVVALEDGGNRPVLWRSGFWSCMRRVQICLTLPFCIEPTFMPWRCSWS